MKKVFIYKILILLSTVVYADDLQLFGGKKSSENEGSKQSFNNDEIVDEMTMANVESVYHGSFRNGMYNGDGVYTTNLSNDDNNDLLKVYF